MPHRSEDHPEGPQASPEGIGPAGSTWHDMLRLWSQPLTRLVERMTVGQADPGSETRASVVAVSPDMSVAGLVSSDEQASEGMPRRG